MAANQRHLDDILDVAETHLAARSLDRCAAVLQAAGYHAWRNHPGVYVSPRLELMARTLGESLPRLSSLASSCSRPTVLHVLTEASQVGGHTRLAWRWMLADTQHRHDVVLTNQRGARIPPDLLRAVARAGGRLTDLSASHRGLMDRARAVGDLAVGADTVIVHSHPHDVVPTVALSGSRTPVALLNHADHVFWTGVSAAHTLVNIRESGRELSERCRGVRTDANLVLPLPLEIAGTPVRDLTARREWDVPHDAALAVTIASPYKFNAPVGVDYLTLHEELVRRSPHLHVRVAGPTDEGAWRAAAERTNGRLRAIGTVQQIGRLYDAADLYLDSFPMGSLTSLLDAAAKGVPVVSFSGIATPHVMTSDDPALSGFDVFFSDQDSYLSRVQALLGDRSLRTETGSRMAEEVTRMHTVEWPTQLGRVYEAAATAAAGGTPSDLLGKQTALRVAAPSEVQDLLISVHDGSGMSVPVWQAWMHQAPHVPLPTRLSWLRHVPFKSWSKAMPQLVADVKIASWRPRLRRLRQRAAISARARPR